MMTMTKKSFPLAGAGHFQSMTVTLDNGYMSLPVMDMLETEFGHTSVGTIRSSKMMPQQIWQKGLPESGHLFARCGSRQLAFERPSGKKKEHTVVGVISNSHTEQLVQKTPRFRKRDRFVQQRLRDENKSMIEKCVQFIYYNFTKCGVDLVDYMKQLYTLRFPTGNYAFAQFQGFLDVVWINAHTLFAKLHPEHPCAKNRRLFLSSVAHGLAEPQAKFRLETISRHCRKSDALTLARYLHHTVEKLKEHHLPAVGILSSSRALCASCPKGKGKKRRKSSRCYTCDKPCCNLHSKRYRRCCDCAQEVAAILDHNPSNVVAVDPVERLDENANAAAVNAVSEQ